MAASDIKPEPGTLLIAPPMMHDPNFRRTVVLLCDHNEEGTFGLILNRPLDLELEDVLEEIESAGTPLSLGGPVQPDTLHFIHRHGDVVPDTIEIMDGVHWGGDFELIKALVEAGRAGIDDLRFFLGYSGWSPDQLQEEIDQGGWILARAHTEAVFQRDPEKLWRAVLRSMGGEYAILANFPEDPRMN